MSVEVTDDQSVTAIAKMRAGILTRLHGLLGELEEEGKIVCLEGVTDHKNPPKEVHKAAFDILRIFMNLRKEINI